MEGGSFEDSILVEMSIKDVGRELELSYVVGKIHFTIGFGVPIATTVPQPKIIPKWIFPASNWNNPKANRNRNAPINWHRHGDWDLCATVIL
ncbi:hypothetical protein FNV43_RR19002 [Rhamnella rubrinervis]|uniref:Uncharacterized protein n=1 Tax=Rhamnella rubrinervis TaxID=2594499 RepID=A0A8K0E5P9_9ROSA|nr:hypothetical protein FNV43_RR19002 [Rhamnella rubrinervis]